MNQNPLICDLAQASPTTPVRPSERSDPSALPEQLSGLGWTSILLDNLDVYIGRPLSCRNLCCWIDPDAELLARDGEAVLAVTSGFDLFRTYYWCGGQSMMRVTQETAGIGLQFGWHEFEDPVSVVSLRQYRALWSTILRTLSAASREE